MADNNKKMVEAITSMEEDFAKWYTDVVKKAELVDYSSVKGCMVIKPYGYAIWELIQKQLDERFKALGHENVYIRLCPTSDVCSDGSDYANAILSGNPTEAAHASAIDYIAIRYNK